MEGRSSEVDRMQYFIHRIGAGEKAAQDLTYEEARDAARLLLSGEATPAQAGGFLVALRVKGETGEEMRAFTEVCREHNRPFLRDKKIAPLDVPVYAGKKTFFHAVIPAALVMAASGQPVFLHGFSEVSERLGVAAVLRALGVRPDYTPEEGAAVLERLGFVYLDVAQLNPPLHRFQRLRNELGVRTILNAVSRMIDPAGSGRHLIGISHPPYFEKTLEVLNRLGSKRTLIVRGVEGGPEPSITSETKGFLSANGKTEAIAFPMEGTGRAWARRSEIPGGNPAEQAVWIARILSGEEAGPSRDWVLLTAAYGLFAAGGVSDLAEGWKRAERGLSGREGLKILKETAKGTP